MSHTCDPLPSCVCWNRKESEKSCFMQALVYFNTQVQTIFAYYLLWRGPWVKDHNDLKALAKCLCCRNVNVVGMTCTHHFVILFWKCKYIKSLTLIGGCFMEDCGRLFRRQTWLNTFIGCPFSRRVTVGGGCHRWIMENSRSLLPFERLLFSKKACLWPQQGLWRRLISLANSDYLWLALGKWKCITQSLIKVLPLLGLKNTFEKTGSEMTWI